MTEYGKPPESDKPPVKHEPPTSPDKQQVKQVFVGCLGLFILGLGGCMALLNALTPGEKLTEKCERDLQSRYNIKGYFRRYSQGFKTIRQGDKTETVAFDFFYDGKKGSSIAAQEGRAPIWRGTATCDIDKETKHVSTTYGRVERFASENP